MPRTKETPYDLAAHREDRPRKARRRRRPGQRKPRPPVVEPDPPTRKGFDRLEHLVGVGFRDKLRKQLGDIDPLAIVPILERYFEARRKAEEVANLLRPDYDEKVHGSLAWRRKRVRDRFKRFDQAVEHFYELFSSGGIADPITFPVLRLTRELRDTLAGDALDLGLSRRRRGPITAYASNDGRTHEGEARYYLKARFGMGRHRQDWWMRAAKAAL